MPVIHPCLPNRQRRSAGKLRTIESGSDKKFGLQVASFVCNKSRAQMEALLHTEQKETGEYGSDCPRSTR